MKKYLLLAVMLVVSGAAVGGGNGVWTDVN